MFNENHPPYTEIGRDFELVGDWPDIVFEPGTKTTPTREPIALPVGRTISPDGTQALTTYYALPTLPVGPGTVALTGTDGTTWRTPTHVYSIVSASLDQDELASDQSTDFVFEFDFGASEEVREAPITIYIEGPIRYELNGLPQVMTISPGGRATHTGTVQALQGSPTGIPFEININVGEMIRLGSPLSSLDPIIVGPQKDVGKESFAENPTQEHRWWHHWQTDWRLRRPVTQQRSENPA